MDAAGMATGVIGATVSIVTLVIMLMRGAFTVEHRITKLETKMEPFWEGLRHLTVNALSGIKPPGNPITPERYRQLIARLNTNTLTHAEAQELNVALLELQQQAQANNDLAKLLAIGLGLLFLAAILKNE